MSIAKLLLFVGAIALAGCTALFLYFFKEKKPSKRRWLFVLLRTSSLFLLLLLLINPFISQNKYEAVKPVLAVAVDNSSSIAHFNASETAKTWVQKLKADTQLHARFDIRYYAFGKKLSDSLSFSFDEKQTAITKTLHALKQIHKTRKFATLLCTDGNQTYGSDYRFDSDFRQIVYPIILGDTTRVVDLKIDQLHTNRYAYFRNQFPVEVFLSYSGNEELETPLLITKGNAIVYRKSIKFSKSKNAAVVPFNLPANRVGLASYTAKIQALATEKNKINNRKIFTVEVIDQKTNIALISQIEHPDLGAIKKSIESQERRKLTILKPNATKDLQEYQLVILYQPTARFGGLMKKIQERKINSLIVSGEHTDWNFLNNFQGYYRQEITRKTEKYIPRLNANYSNFVVEEFGVSDYPPLLGTFGEIQFASPPETLLYRSIGKVETKEPLLCTIEANGLRQGLLLGEGIWRWRSQAYLDQGNFENFDSFFGKLIQYLTSSKRKSRLQVATEPFYYTHQNIVVKSSYFNKNYEFDRRAKLALELTNLDNKAKRTLPFLLKRNNYQVDLGAIPPGEYSYTVSVTGTKISKSGNFKVMEFAIEQQFLNPQVEGLVQLAKHTGGTHFFADQYDALVQSLLQDTRYQTIQKSKTMKSYLIDWKYALGILILLLGLEWFLRKYDGLI